MACPSLPGFDTFTGERQSLAFDDDVLGLASEDTWRPAVCPQALC